MPLQAAIRLDVRLLVRIDDRILLARPPGEAWHVLPGGPVAAGESTDDALERQVGRLAGPRTISRQFIGAVEHDGTITGHSPESATDHVLSIMFAGFWPSDIPTPSRWGEHTLVPVNINVLLATRLRPLSMAEVVRRWLAEGWPLWRGLDPAVGNRRLPSLASLRAQLFARREELRSLTFRDAAVAICALVTAADGRIDPAEREGLLGFIATDPVMSQFPEQDVERLFDEHLSRLTADFAAGKQAALADIAKVRGRATEAAAVVRIGQVIGLVDGEFVASERAVVREAALALGLNTAEFAL
ncbi:tellurite resistance protein [Frankia sp. CcI6]|uniref:TerB family tellurite resistance protein n=1 Tax=Frankia TaxID=1854 RepID=UPI0003CFD5FA|nr:MULTISPECIES: TerB family tellurite resistance protein [Frankia]ETA03237.1 tellurite resistance protein [Frankia sp. CcI6]KFB05031.1 tellurite resistance protein [Frankia sp. Allo2]OAA25784.1 tellurite resistance protein [Frankia casuarinae]OHV55579.1 NUDIX hydrolase [Frankia sp. CgIS1]